MTDTAHELSRPLLGDRLRITTDQFTEPFWQAAKTHRLVAAKCSHCGTFRMPPSPFCWNCQKQGIDWVETAGKGTVYSYTICKSPYRDVPQFTYIPVVVEVPEAPGVRYVGSLVDVDPTTVHVDMAVEVDWHPIQDGWVMPIFRLTKD